MWPAGHHVRLPAPALAVEHFQQAQSASTQQILDLLELLSKVRPASHSLFSFRLLAVVLDPLGRDRSWSRFAAGNLEACTFCLFEAVALVQAAMTPFGMATNFAGSPWA